MRLEHIAFVFIWYRGKDWKNAEQPAIMIAWWLKFYRSGEPFLA